jgi:CRP/FNR family cyclic AMP-dependent transcriptional regulator
MDGIKAPGKQAGKHTAFDVGAFLASAGIARRVVEFRARAVIFSQGDPSGAVMYVQKGSVQISVVSGSGKQAIVATLGTADFFGEGALTGQFMRMGTATTTVASEILVIEKAAMKRVLHEQHAFSDLFIANMLARNLRIEADLVDQLFNSSEKRLARALLLLARYGRQEEPQHPLPKISQEALAEMVGTTRSRVNFFMNKFKKLGFIKYNGGLKINPSLFTVVLHD